MRHGVALLVLFAACKTDTGDLRIIDDLPAEAWSPAEDGDVPMVTTLGCQPRSDAAEGPLLEVAWCVRLSPEPDDTLLDGPGGTRPGAWTGSAAGQRCRYYNMIGAVGLTGPPTDPVVLYCDNDADGGVRIAHLHPDEQTVDYTLVAPEECHGIPQDGGFGGSEGTDSMVGYIDRDDDEMQVFLSEVSRSGVPGRPKAVPGLANPVRATVLQAEDRAALFVQDLDGTLTGRWVGASLVAESESPLAEDVVRFGVAHWGDRQVLASCEDDALWVRTLEDFAPTDVVVVDQGCGLEANPSIAAGDALLAVAWHDGGHAWLSFFDADLREVAQHDLGWDAPYPEVTWDGSRFWSVDFSGAVRSWSATGEPGETYRHPYLPPPEGSPTGLRAQMHDGELTVAIVTQYAIVAGGHQSLTQSLDVVTVKLP